MLVTEQILAVVILSMKKVLCSLFWIWSIQLLSHDLTLMTLLQKPSEFWDYRYASSFQPWFPQSKESSTKFSFLSNNLILVFMLFAWGGGGLCECACCVHWRRAEAVVAHGTGVIGDCDSPSVGVRNQIHVLQAQHTLLTPEPLCGPQTTER